MNKKHTSSSEQISAHLAALKQLLEHHSGEKLPIEEIEAEALKLYQHCVVQRFLQDQPEVDEKEEVAAPEEMPEASVEEKVSRTEEEVEEGEASEDNNNQEDDTEEEVAETSEVEQPIEEEPSESPDKEEDVSEENREVFESFQQEEGMDDGVSYSPIDDLKKAIGLNDRFMFANELFSGHGEEYSRAIEEFNHLESMEDAERLIEAKFAVKYRWNDEDEAVKLFKTFLYRCYLSKG